MVSLMVGSTVDRLCGPVDGGGGGGGGDGGDGDLGNVTTMMMVTENTTLEGAEPETDMCRIEVAVAVTFMGGLVQVRFHFIQIFEMKIEELVLSVGWSDFQLMITLYTFKLPWHPFM